MVGLPLWDTLRFQPKSHFISRLSMIVRMNAYILNRYIKHKLSTINIVYSLKMFYYPPHPTPPHSPPQKRKKKKKLPPLQNGGHFFSVPKVAVVERFDRSILFYFILPRQPIEANKAYFSNGNRTEWSTIRSVII